MSLKFNEGWGGYLVGSDEMIKINVLFKKKVILSKERTKFINASALINFFRVSYRKKRSKSKSFQ